MYSPVQLASRYLKYFLTASNGKGHGIHSPFVFDFIIHVLNDKRSFYAYDKIELIRKKMLHTSEILEVQDFGAGSVTGATKQRKVSEIARHAAKPQKFGQLLFRICNYYQPDTIVELGTSLGVSTAYLASGHAGSHVITMEGAKAIAERARQNFDHAGLKNIRQVNGNFDDTLGPLLNQLSSVDLAFVDGNHRKEPTLRYFRQLLTKTNDQSILIFDDIHWSKEMEEAWEEIKNDPNVLLSIDLFFIGLVFFRKDFKIKQHFTIRF